MVNEKRIKKIAELEATSNDNIWIWNLRSLFMQQLGIIEDKGTSEFFDEIKIDRNLCTLHITIKRK